MLMILTEVFFLGLSILLYYLLGKLSIPFKPFLSLGFIILIAIFNGRLFRRFNLPAITGYMVAGLIISPFTFGLSPVNYIKEFKLIDYFAITFIGLQAGSEMAIRILKKDFRKILTVTILIISISSIGTFLFLYALSPIIKGIIVAGTGFIYVLIFLAVFEVAKSPVTTIAIINETGVRNKFTYTILGITIIKDVILVLLFTVVTAMVELSLAGTSGFSLIHFFPILMELIGSMVIGFIVALIFTLYMKYIKINASVFILIFAFIISFIGNTIHINPLITGIIAGFFIENFSEKNKDFTHILQTSAPYVYILFFPLASAVLDISVVPSVIILVIILLILRKVFLIVSFHIARKTVHIDKFTMKYGWMGLINQSGITLALAILVENIFIKYNMAETGNYLKTIAIASIIITDFYGPPMFKYAVQKSKKIFDNTFSK